MPYKQSLEYHQKWRKANPEKVRAQNFRTKESRQNYWLNRKYGISIGQYNELFTAQKGRCAICNIYQSEVKYRLGLDHNHVTKQNRGLLCFPCNTRLAILENTNWFETAQSYLRGYSNSL